MLKNLHKSTIVFALLLLLISSACDYPQKTNPMDEDPVQPYVTSINPTDDAIDVPIDTVITVTFNEPLNASVLEELGDTALKLLDPAGEIEGTLLTIEGSGSNGPISLKFTPNANLKEATEYSIKISQDIKDLAGHTVAPPYLFTFNTEVDRTPPQVMEVTPTEGQRAPKNTTVTVIFNEEMDTNSISIETFKISINDIPVSGSVTYNQAEKTAVFTPSIDLLSNSLYKVSLETGIMDISGNRLVSPVRWSFKTESDIIPPTVETVLPADTSTNVPPQQVISAKFKLCCMNPFFSSL